MMESEDYALLREMSESLFPSGLVVPIAVAVLAVADVGQTFTAKDVGQELAGRLESNQIRQVLTERLEGCGAVEQLPYPGRPHPRIWKRLDSPFWPFIADWVERRAVRG